MSGVNEPSAEDYKTGETEGHFSNQCSYSREQRGGQFFLRRQCCCPQSYKPKEELHFHPYCRWEQSARLDPFNNMTVYILTKVCECGGNPQQRQRYEPGLPFNEP
ncbi:hypothetical protein Bbelb_171790 [Branchiostoma belcheri]|nr:hypothetical protein Bbelb_171790 [Branchiostoma belcheri]